MSQKLDSMLLNEALSLSQAACYASMSAKEHREGSYQADAMLELTQKLTSMTIAALDAAILPEIAAKPGEQTLADFVDQAKAAAAAGAPIPEIVQTVEVDPAALIPIKTVYDVDPLIPADAATAIADQSITLGDDEYKPLPIPAPLP
jgi:hypothetical protein